MRIQTYGSCGDALPQELASCERHLHNLSCSVEMCSRFSDDVCTRCRVAGYVYLTLLALAVSMCFAWLVQFWGAVSPLVFLIVCVVLYLDHTGKR
jgi:hypothetical protein